jgi:hypothetical protein
MIKSEDNKISTSHIEVYSNDNTNNEITITENEKKKIKNDYRLINIKNLVKYRLPELQDLALEYKISLQINNKKKNKGELIEDIKNYISNKNI